MSIFSSPQTVAARPEPEPDPSVVAMRDAARAKDEAARKKSADRAAADYAGKTMGQQGANAFFTSGAAGYGRTMGSANI